MKISGRSKAMAWVAGAAVAAGVALATYPDAAPAVPPQVPSAEVLQSAVKVAGLIESSSVVDDVPNVSGYQRGCGKGEFCFSECQWPRSSPRRRPVVLPAGGHGFSPVAASCFSPPAF